MGVKELVTSPSCAGSAAGSAVPTGVAGWGLPYRALDIDRAGAVT